MGMEKENSNENYPCNIRIGGLNMEVAVSIVEHTDTMTGARNYHNTSTGGMTILGYESGYVTKIV